MRLLLVLILLSLPQLSLGQSVRIKDIASFDGVRPNDLVGYGLIVGLDGTGDSLRNAPFTEEAISNTLERLGVNVVGETFRTTNVAAVIVTAELPPFARVGSQIDVTVSAIGDASSLLGGTLVMAPLKAADGRTYAVAQGAVISDGFVAAGAAAKEVRGVPTKARIPGGATVEAEVEFSLSELQTIRIALHKPDFSTALQVESILNDHLPGRPARMGDPGTVVVNLLDIKTRSPAHILAAIENLRISPQHTAIILVDQSTGTVVINKDVQVSRVAVSKGGLTVSVTEEPLVIQPNPFGEGESVVVPRTNVEVEQKTSSIVEISTATNLTEIVSGLNAIGVSTNDLIDILKAIHSTGAIHAKFIVE